MKVVCFNLIELKSIFGNELVLVLFYVYKTKQNSNFNTLIKNRDY